MTDATIKTAIAELREWGVFWWRVMNEPRSYSITQATINMKRCETVKHPRRRAANDDHRHRCDGVIRPYDAVATQERFSSASDRDIFVPFQLRELDGFIETLSPAKKIVLRETYQLPWEYQQQARKLNRGLWLDRAERDVMARHKIAVNL